MPGIFALRLCEVNQVSGKLGKNMWNRLRLKESAIFAAVPVFMDRCNDFGD
jgi:hypothetical protein